MRKLYGVGTNDASYVVHTTEKIDGKQKTTWICPFYSRWDNLLKRCYSEAILRSRPTYRGCCVCDDWLLFTNFKEWMTQQVWESQHLDKDLLIAGNKVYSPDTCVFIHPTVNVFTTDRVNFRGKYLLGVSWYGRYNKFRASCSNPFTKKQETLGYFDTELEAHLAWKSRKHELACMLADSELVTDERVAQALRTRYL